MFRSTSKPLTPAEIYATSLERFSLGYPLWSPAPQSLATAHDRTDTQTYTTLGPSTSAEPTQTSPDPGGSAEPQVADVGFLFEGGFIRLLHLDTSAPEKKVTHLDPPFNNIAQLEKNTFLPMKKPNPLQAGHYCSRGVISREAHASVDVPTGPNASLGLKADYTCREARGAALTLQTDADVVVSLPSKLLRQYIRRHLSTWHEYATEDLGLYLKQEEIAVVIGWTKTAPDWAVTAFGVDDEVSASVSLTASIASAATVDVGASSSTSVVTSQVQQQGREYAQSQSDLGNRVGRKDQSVFLKLARAKKRLFLPLRIVARAGYDDIPPWHRRVLDALEEAGTRVKDEEKYAEQCWQEYTHNGKVPDRLDIIQDYIFETSAATVAVVSHDQVDCLLCGQHVVDFASWLRKVRPAVEVDDDGVGSLSMEDVIRYQQEHRFTNPPITPIDTADWPGITRTDAASLVDAQILVGPTEAKANPVTYRGVVFGIAQKSPFRFQSYPSWSPDGQLLAAECSGAIFVWRLQDGLTVQRLKRDSGGHKKSISQVDFSLDGQHIISASSDGAVLVWNIRTGDVVRRLEGHPGFIAHIEFSPDGRQVATRCSDLLKIWDFASGHLLHKYTDFRTIIGQADDICFSPDSSLLAVQANFAKFADEDTAVVLLNCRTGERTGMLRRQKLTSMAFFPKGDRIATGTSDGDVCVWDVASGRALLELKEHTHLVRQIAFSPDGSEMATAASDGLVVTHDSRTGDRHLIFQCEHVPMIENGFASVAYSPINNFIACGAANGWVCVWDALTGASVAALMGHTGWVPRVMFTPDGWDILSYGDDKTMRLWGIRDMLRLS